jgi:hypothetical protein
MTEAQDLHYRLEQLRFLAAETTDPLAERLVREIIVEIEDQLTTTSKRASEPQHSLTENRHH